MGTLHSTYEITRPAHAAMPARDNCSPSLYCGVRREGDDSRRQWLVTSRAGGAAVYSAVQTQDLAIPRTLNFCMAQNWEDPDVPELLTWLEDELREHIAELSSFDVYRKEVLSGSLDWTPMHTSVRHVV